MYYPSGRLSYLEARRNLNRKISILVVTGQQYAIKVRIDPDTSDSSVKGSYALDATSTVIVWETERALAKSVHAR